MKVKAGLKVRRSSKHTGYDTQQFNRTMLNKARRAARRRRRAEHWARVKAMLVYRNEPVCVVAAA